MPDPAHILSPASCRDARELLRLSQEELANLASISVATLRRFELGGGGSSEYAARQIQLAIEREGILFFGPGQTPRIK